MPQTRGFASILDKIVAAKLAEIEARRRRVSESDLERRLADAPPVRDFAAQGFPLRGGRLDYLDGRPVAALVYQRDKHVINLFVWPAGGAGPHLAAERTVQGYNIVHWTAGGMNFWAVSDVERNQLDDFASLWTRAP